MRSVGEIAAAVRRIAGTLPAGTGLVAVSKFHPAEAVLAAYGAGQRTFGESRVQELAAKAPVCPADIAWHFIGHLQTNKVRALMGLRPALIESVDSERLLEIIDAEALRAGFTARVLMQVHVAAETTKTGFLPEELLDYFRGRRYEDLRSTHICGLMAMATNTDDMERVRADFRAAAALKSEVAAMCPDLRGFDTLSMGMSEDYPLAVEEGATLVRVGSAIFGEREP